MPQTKSRRDRRRFALALSLAASMLAGGALQAGEEPHSTISPFDFCRGSSCGTGKSDDTDAVIAAVHKAQALQRAGYGGVVVDFRGGIFGISAPITLDGAPYDISFVNGTVFAAAGYTGRLFDFSSTKSTTDLRFANLVLNGFDRASDLIKMGGKTQGTWVQNCTLAGFVHAAFWDPSTVAGTENKIDDNTIQGGRGINRGTGIILDGIDSEVRENLIRNVQVGIRLKRPSTTVALNHIYSAEPRSPIPLVEADTGDQLQILDNYLDEGYLLIRDPSGTQIENNRFLIAGGVDAAGYNPIVLQPLRRDAILIDLLITGNRFRSLLQHKAPIYTPVRLDESVGTAGKCYNCFMRDNGFFGFKEQTTEPSILANVDGQRSLDVNMDDKIPFGALTSVTSVVPSGVAYRDIANIEVKTKNTVRLSFFTRQTGSIRLQATINSN